MIIKTVVIAQNVERIISTKIEHKAVLNSIESIAKEREHHYFIFRCRRIRSSK